MSNNIFISVPAIQTNSSIVLNDLTLLANISMGASFTSTPILLTKNMTYAFQAAWTGTPVGIFTLKASCDTASDPINIPPTHFDPISGASSPAGGLAGSLMFSYQGFNVPYNWVQLFYTRTSGSGNLVSLTFNGR